MPLYVFALLEAPLRPPLPRGLRGAALALRRTGPWVAAVESRPDPPPLDVDALWRQQQIVERLARRSGAVLPARFGTLLAPAELDRAVRVHTAELRDGFARVRGRVQMTWRFAGAPSTPARAARAVPPAPASGAAYLRSRVAASHPRPPRRWKALRETLAAFVSEERYEAGPPGASGALYHLVLRSALRAYLGAARRAARVTPGARVTGPVAPYAFTPELW